MGKNKKNSNNSNGNGDSNEDKQPPSVAFKIDFHCNGCCKKIMKCVRQINGIETTKAEPDKNKLTLTVAANIDPVKLRDELGKKTKKKVELFNSEKEKQNKKDGGEKELQVKTVVLKVAWHCQGCARKIHKILSSLKGVHNVSFDKEKDQVAVRGAVDPKVLVESLKGKLKRQVDIVPEKNKEKEKDKSAEGSGSDGKDKDKVAQAGDKFEYFIAGGGYGCRDVKSGQVIDIFYPPQYFSEENAHSCSVM